MVWPSLSSGALVVGAGVTVGVLAADMSDEWSQQAALEAAAQVVADPVSDVTVPRPVVVTRIEERHVTPKPVVVHRKVYIRVPAGQSAPRPQAPRAKAAPQRQPATFGGRTATVANEGRSGSGTGPRCAQRSQGDVEDLMSTVDMGTVEIVEQRWRTTLSVTLPAAADVASIRRAEQVLTTEVDRLERAASRFRADSEISAVNRAAGQWVRASALLVELVEVALAAADSTGGLVDPCLGRQVDAAGYRTWAAGDVSVLDPAPPVPVGAGGWREVEVAPGRVRIPPALPSTSGRRPRPGWPTRWPSGSPTRSDSTWSPPWAATCGSSSRPPGWVVGADHEVPGVPERAIAIAEGGLATSGQGRRRWLTTSGPAHHLIDPRTGRSADTGWWAVSALAASATTANVAATAGMLLDEDAPAWFAERGLHGLFTRWSGSGRATAHTVGQWPGMEDAA